MLGGMVSLPIGGNNSKLSNATHFFIMHSVANGYVNGIANRAVHTNPGFGSRFS